MSVLTENALPHNLSTHGDEQSEMEHVTGPNEPVHENGSHWRAYGELGSRLDGGIFEKREESRIQQETTI